MKSKKYKVEIPKGYEVERTSTCNSHNADNSPRIYKEVIFKPIKKQLPKTWEEYIENPEKAWHEIGVMRMATIPKYQNAFMALNKLMQLRDHYNDGWEPDWTNADQIKHGINFMNGGVLTDKYSLFSAILSFKTPELRDEFLSNFRKLIETAKPLL